MKSMGNSQLKETKRKCNPTQVGAEDSVKKLPMRTGKGVIRLLNGKIISKK
jgi:hypothetical protein